VLGQSFVSDKKIGVYCDEKSLIIERLKPAGKNEMSPEEFLSGYGSRL